MQFKILCRQIKKLLHWKLLLLKAYCILNWFYMDITVESVTACLLMRRFWHIIYICSINLCNGVQFCTKTLDGVYMLNQILVKDSK